MNKLFKKLIYFSPGELLLIFIYKSLNYCLNLIPQKLLLKREILNTAINNGFRILKKERKIYSLTNNTNEILIRKNSSDIYVFHQIFIQEEYKSLIDIIVKNQIEINTIIDCGANIGLSTIYFNNYFPQSKKFCIEPFPSNVKIIEENGKVNNVKNLILLENGIWYKNAHLKLDNSFRDGKEWSISVKEANSKADLEGISLNELITRYDIKSIDILKIDIEGTEKYIFDKTISNLSFLNITKTICIEIHDEFKCRDMINSELIRYGFDLIRFGELTIGIKNEQ